MKKLLILAFIVALLSANRAHASAIVVHVGPPSVGNGGSNPLSIPPVSIVEYEFVYVTEKDTEYTLGIFPGSFYGARSTIAGGTYVGFGGGLVLSSNGGGPGIYSSIGTDLGSGAWKFNAELKQAIGFDFAKNIIISPYALRIGVTYEW